MKKLVILKEMILTCNNCGIKEKVNLTDDYTIITMNGVELVRSWFFSLKCTHDMSIQLNPDMTPFSFPETEKSDYEMQILSLLQAIPEVTMGTIFDINGNLISYGCSHHSSAKNTYSPDDIQDLIFSSAVTMLSSENQRRLTSLGESEQFFIRGTYGYLLFMGIDTERILAVQTTKDIKLGLVFLDTKRTVDKLAKLSYEMPARKVNLKDKLNEIQANFQDKYRIFFSYAGVDSKHFHIPEIASFLESQSNSIEIRYFERDKTPGEDILDYMENGIKWCNYFVWFHSINSKKSGAVIKEYKMATYEGKKIITVTDEEDINLLPLSIKITWILPFKEDINFIGKKIYDYVKKLSNYTIEKDLNTINLEEKVEKDKS